MIDYLATFILGAIVGAAAVGAYVYWKIRKLKNSLGLTGL